MNHDGTHCTDYVKGVCPRSCYRAELTEDLSQRADLAWLPISWASFIYSEECPFRLIPWPNNPRSIPRKISKEE
jgi:hypothetical protein